MQTGAAGPLPLQRPGLRGGGSVLRRRPLGLRALLGGAFLIVGLLAAAVAAVAVGSGAVARLREEAGADLAGAAAQVAELLDRGMFERWRDLQIAASLDTIRDPAASRDAKRAVLKRLEETYPDYAVVVLIGADGRISVTSEGSFEGLDVSGRDYFIGGRIGPYAGDVHEARLLAARLPNRPAGEPPRFMDVAAPIRTPAGEPAGVLAAHLLREWAAGVERSVLDRLGARRPGAEALVVSGDGVVLLGPRHWRGRRLPALPGSGDRSAAKAIGHGSGPWPGEGIERDGAAFVAGWAPTRGHLDYPGLGWRVVVRQPAAAALAPAATIRREVLLWGGAAAALAAALGWALAGTLARPLAALADAAEALRRGDGGAGAAESKVSAEQRGGTAGLYRETGSIAASLGGLLAQLRRAARESEAAHAEVAVGEARLARALAAARAATWDWDAATGAQHVSPGFCDLLGRPPGAVRSADDLVACAHPDDRGAVSASFRSVMGSAGEGGASEVEFRAVWPNGGVRWLRLQGAARRDADGSVLGAGCVVVDVTARREAEERQALLMREVDHRAKNALAVVQAVLRLTRADDPKAFARAVEGRVTALARAQTLLSKDRWAGADLRAILAEELAAYRPTGGSTAPGGGQVTLDGPPVLLAPGAAQPLAMALHELATNAAKYGALSTPNGRVGVSWRLDPATGALKLRWTERGGPPVAGPPTRRGFGSRVVEETLRRQLGGDERRTWAPEGLVCDLEVPADKLAPAKGASVNPAAPDPPSAPPARRRHAVAPTTAAG